jgi:hypothetical protein
MKYRDYQLGFERMLHSFSCAACLALAVGVVTGAASASTLDGSSPPAVESTDLLVVYGHVFQPDGMTYWEDGRTLTITNRGSGVSGAAWIGAMETGSYEIVLVGLGAGPAASVGDTLAVAILGGVVHSGILHIVTGQDVAQNTLQWDLQAHVLEAIAVPAAGRGAILGPNHPNPFNPRTTITFALFEAGRVQLSLHDLRGRHVATLLDGFRRVDTYAVSWDGRNEAGLAMPSGVYLMRLRTEKATFTRKITLAR